MLLRTSRAAPAIRPAAAARRGVVPRARTTSMASSSAIMTGSVHTLRNIQRS